MITWNMTVNSAEERAAQDIADHLSELTGLRVARAAAVRWAVRQTADRLRKEVEAGDLS